MRIVYAKSNTAVPGPHGGIFSLSEGEAWDADDPVVAGRPDAFSDTPVRVRTSHGYQVVESATAAPGQRRRLS